MPKYSIQEIQALKDQITEYEEYNDGHYKLNGHWVKAVNVRKTKSGATADIIIHDDEGNSQRYNDCEYTDEALSKIKTQSTERTV
jgi:hypothetical protein